MVHLLPSTVGVDWEAREISPSPPAGSCTLPPHQVKTPDESRSLGRISKQWGGLLREALTDADDFGLQFPLDLDVRVKAVLLGATFLIVSWLPRLPSCYSALTQGCVYSLASSSERVRDRLSGGLRCLPWVVRAELGQPRHVC